MNISMFLHNVKKVKDYEKYEVDTYVSRIHTPNEKVFDWKFSVRCCCKISLFLIGEKF